MKNHAYTLAELLIAVVLLVIVVSIGIPALRAIKTETDNRGADGNAKTLSDGRNRAVIDGWNDPCLSGSDPVALATFLVSNGYVSPK